MFLCIFTAVLDYNEIPSLFFACIGRQVPIFWRHGSWNATRQENSIVCRPGSSSQATWNRKQGTNSKFEKDLNKTITECSPFGKRIWAMDIDETMQWPSLTIGHVDEHGKDKYTQRKTRIPSWSLVVVRLNLDHSRSWRWRKQRFKSLCHTLRTWRTRNGRDGFLRLLSPTCVGSHRSSCQRCPFADRDRPREAPDVWCPQKSQNPPSNPQDYCSQIGLPLDALGVYLACPLTTAAAIDPVRVAGANSGSSVGFFFVFCRRTRIAVQMSSPPPKLSANTWKLSATSQVICHPVMTRSMPLSLFLFFSLNPSYS